ncbi:FMRFamide receptor-like [Haliotis rubra]|uniref:FMRFamide receptor-like n=1 Tax=Haliotis rubra TaxID=36100 RepID=UPI001EE547B3|nr:FMRFamide receptor-like [Haliotis rubra]
MPSVNQTHEADLVILAERNLPPPSESPGSYYVPRPGYCRAVIQEVTSSVRRSTWTSHRSRVAPEDLNPTASPRTTWKYGGLVQRGRLWIFDGMFQENWSVSTFISDMLRNVTQSILDISSETEENDTDLGDAVYRDEIWTGRVGIYGIGGTAIALFGLVANAMAIIVLSQYKQKSSAPLLLILLALCDSTLLGSDMVLETLATLSGGNVISGSYNDWLKPGYVYLFHVSYIAQTGTTYMTVLITVERYIAVVKPLLAARLCSRSAAWKASAAILVWSIVYHTPRYLAYTNYYEYQADTNSTKLIFNRTDFGNGFFYKEVFMVWINFSLEFFVPAAILVVLNVLLIRALKKSKSFEVSRAGARARKGQRLTAMVLAVTSLFFFCELFSVTSLIITRSINNYRECSVFCNNFIALADTMVIVNSASNFFLYCAVGKRFRDIFLQMFCRIPFRTSRSSSSNTRTTSQGHTKMVSMTKLDRRSVVAN